MSINSTVLTGRLTRDVELRTTQSGLAVAQFTLAVDRPTKERDADFISCVAWRKQAEVLQQYTHKGSQIGIEGHIQTRNYDDKDGRKVYVTEVIANRIELLDPRSDKSEDQSNYTTSNRKAPKKPVDPFADNAGSVEITEKDLPF